jgi:hypothetical protein
MLPFRLVPKHRYITLIINPYPKIGVHQLSVIEFCPPLLTPSRLTTGQSEQWMLDEGQKGRRRLMVFESRKLREQASKCSTWLSKGWLVPPGY